MVESGQFLSCSPLWRAWKLIGMKSFPIFSRGSLGLLPTSKKYSWRCLTQQEAVIPVWQTVICPRLISNHRKSRDHQPWGIESRGFSMYIQDVQHREWSKVARQGNVWTSVNITVIVFSTVSPLTPVWFVMIVLWLMAVSPFANDRIWGWNHWNCQKRWQWAMTGMTGGTWREWLADCSPLPRARQPLGLPGGIWGSGDARDAIERIIPHTYCTYDILQ